MIAGPLAFDRPWFLLAALPLAVFLWRQWRLPGSAAPQWEKVVDAHLLPHLLRVGRQRSETGQRLRLGTAAILAIVALAGPSVDTQQGTAFRHEATRLLVVDLSPPTGEAVADLEDIKRKILDLLQAMPEGNTGLIVYAGEPYLVVPPTSDPANVALFVRELSGDALPVPGNRPEYALSLAGRSLANSPRGKGEIIWMTTAPPLKLHLDRLPHARLAIWSLPAGGTPSPGPGAQAALRVRFSEDQSDIASLGAFLATGVRETEQASVARRKAIGYWLLLPLLLLLAPGIRQGRAGLLIGPALLTTLLLPVPADAGASYPALLADRLAWRHFRDGDVLQASRLFRDASWRAAANYRLGQYAAAADDWARLDDPVAHYNRGNTLARQGRYLEALDAYDRSLAQRPDDADTRHNRDLVERLLRQDRSPDASAGGQPPPAGKAPPKSGKENSSREQEADRLAEQWLRRVPEQGGTLFRRKIMIEHQRRLSGAAEKAW